MIRLLFCILLFFAISCIGCTSTSRQLILEGPQDHEHFHSRTKAIGDYHAQLVVNHRRGKIFLAIYDINEEPKKIRAKKVMALMTLSDGCERELSFEPTTYIHSRSRNRPISYKYYIQGDWIKSVHKFDITFFIPIRQNIYEASYAYITSDLEDIHHKHKDCGDDCPYY